MVIEILSRSSQSEDRGTKKSLYEKVGVKEYWIIDPTTNEAVRYFLESAIYKEVAALTVRCFPFF